MDAPPSDVTPRPLARWSGVLIALAAFAVYLNALGTPFIFDDHPSITGNPTLGSFAAALHPPADGRAVTGRPIVNLSLAFNRWIGGDSPRGYHACNVLLHAAAGLLLFGIVRRAAQCCATASVSARAGTLGFLAALLWLCHPLQTESVTFVIQRTESLAGLLYLLTVYAFARAAESAHPWRWRALSVAASALGMATKEILVTAPLVVLLYDRTFVARSFGEAWRRGRGYYAALAGSWLVLVALLFAQRNSARVIVGSFDPATNAWTYLLTQASAIVKYVSLAVWPHPLVVDYGTGVVRELGAVWPQALLVLAALAATVFALRRAPVAGFLGACFFLILAPSSSFVPLPAQTMAEHRMYLPLASLAIAAAAGVFALCGLTRSWLVLLATAVPLALLTVRRNADYASEERIWRDTIAKVPGNWRAYYNLGWALEQQQRLEPARAELERAVELKPTHAESHAELGAVYLQLDRLPDAIAQLRRALELGPANASARHNLGYALLKAGRPAAAADEFAIVLRLREDPLAHLFRAKALVFSGRPAEAIPEYLAAIAAMPTNAAVHREAGAVFLQLGRTAEARAHFESALAHDPNDVAAREQLQALSANKPR